MVRSMTGFGVADGPVAGGTLKVEIRSVTMSAKPLPKKKKATKRAPAPAPTPAPEPAVTPESAPTAEE